MFDFALQIGDVKAVPVKMNEKPIVCRKLDKGIKYIFFVVVIGSEPLD